jgi:hypothetical protein
VATSRTRSSRPSAGTVPKNLAVSDGDRVCSVVDWTMAPVPGTLSAAEVLEVRDGQIVRGELFYDAEELRKAMAQGPPG